MIKYRDVTGVLLHFSHEQIEALVEALSPEQRRFSAILGNTIKQPHEIWRGWVVDETDKGQWHNVRSYLQYLDLSQTDAGVAFGVATLQFAYRSRWELANVGLVFGTQESVMKQVDKRIRIGSIEYSNIQH